MTHKSAGQPASRHPPRITQRLAQLASDKNKGGWSQIARTKRNLREGSEMCFGQNVKAPPATCGTMSTVVRVAQDVEVVLVSFPGYFSCQANLTKSKRMLPRARLCLDFVGSWNPLDLFGFDRSNLDFVGFRLTPHDPDMCTFTTPAPELFTPVWVNSARPS